MKRSLPRELLLLTAPLFLLGAVGFWAMRRPKPVAPAPKKWRIETELTRKALLPVEVRRGVDTRFVVRLRVLSPKDTTPAMQGSLWNDIRLVETDERGNDKRVWDATRRYHAFAIDDWKRIENLGLGGSGGGNAELWNADYNFALRRLPHPTRHLELRVDSVWRPVTTQDMVINATPGQVAQMRVLSDALSTSRRLVLRQAGQSTPVPRASTDPLFDVRRIEVRYVGKDLFGQSVVRVIWHILWRGPHKRNGAFEFAPCSLGTYDDKNNRFESNQLGLDVERGKQGSFSVFYDTSLSGIRSQAKLYGSKALFVKGWFSINGRWPRQVNLKLPNWVLRK